MSQFMRAHGYLPGPTQQPVLTGAVTGIAASVASVPLAWGSGALLQLARGTGLPTLAIVAMWVVLGPLAGALYGRIFMRAANDRRGGWLFGIGYGFLLWMLGPASLLPWIVGHPPVVGRASQAFFASHIVYGLALGVLFPVAERLLRSSRPTRPRQPQAAGKR